MRVVIMTSQRRLLSHEVKLVQLMCGRSAQHPFEIPDLITNSVLADSCTKWRGITINPSFVHYFAADAQPARLSLVRAAMCIPTILGNELFLVHDKTLHKLAFLEFFSSAVPIPLIRQYVGAIYEGLRGVDKDARERLCHLHAAFVRGSPHYGRKSVFKRIRLLVIDSVICFYAGTSDTMLLYESARSEASERPEGVCHVLRLHQDFAVEGWLQLEPFAPGSAATSHGDVQNERDLRT